MTAAFDELLARGGKGERLEYAIAIEGIREAFASSHYLHHSNVDPFIGADGRRKCYRGLVVGNGFIAEEEAHFREARLEASGMRFVVEDNDAEGDEIATRVFGGRRPARKTYLTADLGKTDTTVNVESTEGYPASGVIWIGREALSYSAKNATQFTGCIRGWYGSFACKHPFRRKFAVEVCDAPKTLRRRRVQLYVFVDGETTGTVIWRGVIRSVRQSEGGRGYVVTADHNVSLLKQDIGVFGEPFGLRGFYFSDAHPFTLYIGEANSTNAHYERVCTLKLPDPDLAAGNRVAFFATLQDLITELNQRLDPVHANTRWKKSSDWTLSAPINVDYKFVRLENGTIGLSFRTASGDKRLVGVYEEAENSRMPSGFPGSRFGASHKIVDEAGVQSLTLANDKTYYLIPNYGTGYLDRQEAPDAFAFVFSAGLTAGPIAASQFKPNRVYYDKDIPQNSVLAFDWTNPGNPDARWHFKVTNHVMPTGSAPGYFEVEVESLHTRGGRTFPAILSQYADQAIEFKPTNDYGEKRWDAWLQGLIDASPDSGTQGTAPWLPSEEFDMADIAAEVTAAGGDRFVKSWELGRSGKLEEILRPELQSLGLCWATTKEGKLTVRRITTAAAGREGEITLGRDAMPRRQPIVADTPEGIANTVYVMGGWNPDTEEYEFGSAGAIVDESVEDFGEQRLVIEPRTREIVGSTSFASAAFRAEVAASLVNIYAHPYEHVEIGECPGYRGAAARIGGVVRITDDYLPHLGARGVSEQRATVIGRRVTWSNTVGHPVDLRVLLTDANVAGYAPSARCKNSSPLIGSDTIEMRQENRYYPAAASGTFYDYRKFQAGDKVRIHQEDVTTAATQDVTIVQVDPATHRIQVSPNVTLSMNTAGTRWRLSYQDYDTATNQGDPPQRAYCFIADDKGKIGTGDAEDARVWGS